MRATFVVCLVVGCVAFGEAASAQTATGGSIRGFAKDELDAVLKGVRITAMSPDEPQPHDAVSDDEGFYRLLDLPPGTYRINAELDGFAKWIREGVMIRAGLNVNVPVVMKLGTLNETLEVRPDSPLLETSTFTQAFNIQGDLQRQLPLSSRSHWTDFMLVTPGVASQTLATQRQIFFLHGSGFDSQVTLIDGADVSPAAQNFAGTVNVSSESLEDVQVKMGGIDASAPLGAGAVINAVTKSGGSRFSGSGAATYQPKRWNSSNVSNGTSSKTSLFQADASLGGPLKRDAVWIFGSHRHTQYAEGLDRTPQQLATLAAFNPSFTPFDRHNDASFVLVKPTARLGNRFQLQGFYKYDVNPLDSVSSMSAAQFAHSVSGGHAGSARLQMTPWAHLVVRLSASATTAATSVHADRTDRPQVNIHAGAVPNSGRLQGTGIIAFLDNVSNYTDASNNRMTYAADADWHVKSRALGSHEIGFGGYFQRLRIGTTTRYVNAGFVLEERVLRDAARPEMGAIPFHRLVYGTDEVLSQFTNSRDSAVYVQDRWRFADRLTANIGFRVDRIIHKDLMFGIDTQRSVDAGLRAGINYVITGDQRNVLQASWVRRHDATPVSIVAAGSNVAGSRDEYDTDRNGSFETVFTSPASVGVARDRIFDLTRHQPFVNEAIVSYTRQLTSRATADLSIIRQDFRDRVALVETNGIYDGGVFRGYRNIAARDIYLVTNDRWSHQVYNGMEIKLTTTFAGLQAVAGYTRQWRQLEGTWRPNDPAGFIQPEAFSNSRGIGYPRGFAVPNEANSLSGSNMVQNLGPTSQWQDHVLNAGAVYGGPFGLMLSTNYVFTSGPWSGPVVTRLPAPDPRFGSPTILLPNGVSVPNPLATTFRFVGANRDDGQFTLPALHIWNVSMGRVFKTGRGQQLDARVSLLNASNHGADQILQSGGNQTFSANFRKFTQRQSPRSIQVRLRASF